MDYINGKDVLPEELLRELQRYVQGKLIYIPKRKNNRAQWGKLNGTKEMFKARNHKIYNLYLKGKSIEKLMEKYSLSEESIRKIIANS